MSTWEKRFESRFFIEYRFFFLSFFLCISIFTDASGYFFFYSSSYSFPAFIIWFAIHFVINLDIIRKRIKNIFQKHLEWVSHLFCISLFIDPTQSIFCICKRIKKECRGEWENLLISFLIPCCKSMRKRMSKENGSSFLWAFFYSLFFSLQIFLPILFAFFWTIEWIKCEEGLAFLLTLLFTFFDDKQDANRNDKRNISSSYFLHGFLYFSNSRRYKKDAKRKWGHAMASMQLAHAFCNIFYIFLIERNIKRDAENMSRNIVFVLILALI